MKPVCHLLLATVLLASPAVFAQSSPPAKPASAASVDETVQLSAFEVKSAKDTAYRVENSVATTGIAQSLFKTPLAITVVTGEFMKDAGLEGFMGALRYISSLSFDPHAANGNFTAGIGSGNSQPNLTRFRGQPYNGTYRNGLRLEFGFFTENVDRIEVAKGPMAVFVGGATLGGEVNLVTKQPLFSRQSELSLRVGSHESFNVGVDSTGPLTKTLAYRVIASHDDRHTWREHSRSQTDFVNPQLLWRPWEKLSTHLDLQFRNARGNLVSQNTSSTKNYQADFDQPRLQLLAFGARRTTGPAAGQPFTVDEYRARISQAFGTWRQDVYDLTGRWETLGRGEGLTEDNAPTGRRYNYYGPRAHFTEPVTLLESETTLVATDWLDLRLLGRYTKAKPVQDYYWFGSRIYAGGNTRLISGDSVRLTDQRTDAKLEGVFKKKLGWFKTTLLLGGQYGKQERTTTQGAWDYSTTPAVAASPNVFGTTAFGTPNPLVGVQVYDFFDPRVQAFPDTRLAQRWADEVRPAGVRSRDYRKSLPAAFYSAGSIGVWDDRVVFTGGVRRNRSYDVNTSLDRNGEVVSTAGVLQTSATKRIYTNSWMYGGVVGVAPGINAYASYNYGETFQSGSLVGRVSFGISPPDIVTAAEQAANPNPNAVGKGKEAGLKFEFFNRKLTGSAGWFSLTRGGILVTDSGRTALDPRNAGTEVDANLATANPGVRYRVSWSKPIEGNTSEGYETDWLWTPTSGLSFIVAASHLTTNRITVDKPASTDPIVLRTYTILNGRPLENSPNDTFRFFGRYLFTAGALKGFSTGLGVRYQSKVQPSANDANWGLVFPSFSVADLTLGYATKLHGRDTSFLLSVTNATNRSYFEGGRIYGAPREFSLTTRVKF